ncbi:MAG TPA: toll/interleukin-1 receptor domain-containing protein [Devosia sp.]|nr:toll/interleukin-1 receptor domain-containing protein [Devosia sp.]
MKLESGWRYGNPGPISPHAVSAFFDLIAKIAAQGQRWGIFEGFKKRFAGVSGRSYAASSSESWAESDLGDYLSSAASNAPLFIEAFYDGCEELKSDPNLELPDAGVINQLLRTHEVGYEIRPPNLVAVAIDAPLAPESEDERPLASPKPLAAPAAIRPPVETRQPVQSASTSAATLFFSYSHKDEIYRDRLELGLAMLKRQGLIATWHDRRIVAGDDFAGKIDEAIERADIILLLVSPDFLGSAYCYDVEMARALERHHEGTARVIPVILRPCEWTEAPFGRLRATPIDGKAVSRFADIDEAYLEITKDIRRAINGPASAATAAGTTAVAATLAARPPVAAQVSSSARSSNLALKKTFTDADIDRFREETFEFIERFFMGSLNELKARNDGIDTAFRVVDSNRFVARLYRNGKLQSVCQIALGGSFGKTITFSHSEEGNAVNEILNVEADDQGMFLSGMGMPSAGMEVKHLSAEGAAEYFWSLFIAPMQ